MSYWIFVHKTEHGDTLETFQQLMEKKNWGLPLSVRPLSEDLQPGDTVVFYLGGPDCRYLKGEAKLRTVPYQPTRDSIGGPVDQKIVLMVDFDTIDLWEGKIIKLTLRHVREKLTFISNKDNWGMTFQKSVMEISKDDYETIKSLVV